MDEHDLEGVILKGYECREKIGAGAFGVVYRAYQTSIGREVAIKMILPKFANQPEFIRRFEVEAQLIARLEHPHIVPLYDYWRDPEGAFLTMRWLRSSLRSSLKHGAWKLTDVARLLDQVASAMALAHREGIIHRDIHPNNILLDEDNNAYLADFGIAKNIYLRQTTFDDLSGLDVSSEYWSPEQIRNEPVTNRTDIYSLGYVVYELVTGEKAFPDAQTPRDYVQSLLTKPLPMVSSRKANIPAALDEVLQTATAKEPSHRYPTALRFAAAFRAAIPAVLPSTSWQPLVEPLTGRELEVLKLMTDDMSTREIADRLVVTSETVRWYIKQIYRKLDVNSRQQAVERALSLKLNQPGSTSARVQVIESEMSPAQGIEALILGEELENPYKGLRAFQEGDFEDFFGRAALTERLLSRLSEAEESSRILFLVGPSGSGKSSVVRAGLIPVLRKGALVSSPTPFIADFLPGAYPLEELEVALLRVSVNPLPDLFTQLSEDRRGLARAAKQLLPADPQTELILFIDQLEEVFTLVEDEAVRTHFIDLLLAAVTDPRSRVRVIATLRADFLDRPLMYPRLAELVRTNSELIVPLTVRELEQAIVAPVERMGMRLEAGLVATILDDVGEQPGTLPLLEYALTELFECREGAMLTLEGYKATGGVAGALGKRADKLYEGFDDRDQEIVRQLFLRLITLGEGTEDTRRRVLISEVIDLDNAGRMEEVINAYVDHRLLTLDHDPVTRSPTVEIAHEALIREWSKLREWLLNSREDLRVQRRLAYMTEEWRRSEDDPSFLARGAQLTQFEEWVAVESGIVLSTRERQFLEASLSQRGREHEAEAERQAREQQLERRSRTFLRGLVAVLAIGLLAALLLTGAAVAERERAETNEQIAVAERERAEANFARAEQQRLYLAANEAMDNGASGNVGMALALRSLEYGYTPGADAALIRAGNQGVMRLELTGHQFEIHVAAYSSDGSLIATSSEGGTWIYDAETGEQLHFLPQNGVVLSGVFSPVGNYILTTSDQDSRVRLWDAESGELVRTYAADSRILFAYFTGDASQIFVHTSEDVQIRDVETGRRLESYPRYVGDSDSEVRFNGFYNSPDGNRQSIMNNTENTRVYLADPETGEETCILLDSGADGARWETLWWDDVLPIAILGTDESIAYAWNLETCTLISQFAGHSNIVIAIDYDPNQDIVVTGDNGGKVIAWELQTGQEISHYNGSNEAVRALDISPDGASLVTNLWDSVAVWDVTVSREPRQVISGEFDRTYFPRFAPDGESIYIGGLGGYSRWSLDENVPALMIAYEQYIRTLDVSPDGRYLAVAIEQTSRLHDNSLYLLDADTGEVIREFVGSTALNNFIDFSPDGSRIAVGSFDLAVRIWDVETAEQLHVLWGHTGVISSAVFSPDGRRLVTSGTDGTIRVWDTDTGDSLHVFDIAPSAYAVFSPDGSLIALGDLDGIGYILDADAGEILHHLTGHTANIWVTNFSPDGTQLVTASWDGTARVWDVETGNLIRVLDNGKDRQIFWAEYSPDGEYIVTGSEHDDRVYIWQADLDALIESMCSHQILDLSAEQRVQYGINDDDPVCPTSNAPA